MPLREHLLDEIDVFLRSSGMRASVFGRLAADDSKFVERLRGGADCTTRTLERVRSFMFLHKPLTKRNGQKTAVGKPLRSSGF
jgi:hypothetical protein